MPQTAGRLPRDRHTMVTMAPARKQAPRSAQATAATYNRSDPNHLLVDPRWLMKIFGYTVLAAFLCAYLLMCVLFRLGSWQRVLHPTQTGKAGTSLAGEVVHFAPDGSGTPQLTGEWIPADTSDRATVIYLRPGDGQLDFADAPLLRMLHQDGFNVLAFDYRGYGRSAKKPHPSEARMQQDAETAWSYVTGLRRVPGNQVLLYGAGVGATLATNLAQAHPEAAGLVLRNATADVLGTLRSQKRARMFPVGLLLADRFDLHALATVKTPKLLWQIASPSNTPEADARTAAYRSAADPKMIVTLPNDDPAAESASLRRFLDEQSGLLPPVPIQPLPSAR